MSHEQRRRDLDDLRESVAKDVPDAATRDRALDHAREVAAGSSDARLRERVDRVLAGERTYASLLSDPAYREASGALLDRSLGRLAALDVDWQEVAEDAGTSRLSGEGSGEASGEVAAGDADRQRRLDSRGLGAS